MRVIREIEFAGESRQSMRLSRFEPGMTPKDF